MSASEWVVWNGFRGCVESVGVADIERDDEGAKITLVAPYSAFGPLNLDQLLRHGRIETGDFVILSPARWREDQVELRMQARERRRAGAAPPPSSERRHRELLELPERENLSAARINAAFRRLAKSAHPDAGGNDALFRALTEARDALLAQAA